MFTNMLQSISKILTLTALILVIASCSSSKNAVATPARDDVKGTWTLGQITYEGLATSEKLKLNLLDEGTDVCLTGSTWVLPNNGNGSYTINSSQSGCTSGQKNIVWSYRKEGDQPIFQFKKMQGGVKAKNVVEGYKFKILSASANNMLLQSEITYQGKPIYINYSFSKS
jgi:hypothetical protein